MGGGAGGMPCFLSQRRTKRICTGDERTTLLSALAVTSARTTLCFVLTPRRKVSVVRGLHFFFGSAVMAVVVFNVLPVPDSEMSLSPLELINDQFKKRTAKEGSRSVTKWQMTKGKGELTQAAGGNGGKWVFFPVGNEQIRTKYESSKNEKKKTSKIQQKRSTESTLFKKEFRKKI